MQHEAASFYESWPKQMGRVKEAAPDVPRAFAPFFQGLMKEGALTVKQKELIAMSIGVATRCEPCIYAHVEKCVKLGASREEVLEAAGVAVMMGGGPVYTYMPVVVAALDATLPAAG